MHLPSSAVGFMNRSILVGNLSTSVNEDQIKDLFSETGATVVSITIPTDPVTGICRGYAFVEMSNSAETSKAIKKLNGQDFGGRPVALTLVEMQPEKKRKWYQFGS